MAAEPIMRQASVPDIIELSGKGQAGKQGILCFYTVDARDVDRPGGERISRLLSTDGGKTWSEPVPIVLDRRPGRGAMVDPSVVQLEDGPLRLYFYLYLMQPHQRWGGPGPAHCFYSAVSKDGLHFEVERGVRIEAAGITDPEVIRVGDQWLMFISRGPETLLARSHDGLKFRWDSRFRLDGGGVPGALALADGTVRVFQCGRGGIVSVLLEPGSGRVRREPGMRVRGAADLAAWELAGGGYVMILKRWIHRQPTGPRPGPPARKITVRFVESSYKTARGGRSGWFTTGQAADIVLSAIDFNNTGGPLLFNHNAGIASDGIRLLLADRNNNRVLIWQRLPKSNVEPTLVLGQKDFTSNSPGSGLDQLNWPVSVAAVGGKVIVADAYNHRVLVWNSLPNRNGQPADLAIGGIRWPWGVWTYGVKLVVSVTGERSVLVWNRPPLEGQLPDLTFHDGIGGVRFQRLKGVALDDRYFYLADAQANRIWVWEGIPAADSEPKFVLRTDRPARLTSDGRYLVVAPSEAWSITVYRVSELACGGRLVQVGRRGWFNLPQGALVAGGHLFVADTCFNRVRAWGGIEDALAGNRADVILGASDLSDTTPEIGRDKLFWPGAVSFDGSYLWVGEFKFSGRLARFSVH